MPRQFSPHPDHPAVGFLLRLHADLAGKVQQNKVEAEQLQEGVRHVEAAIKMFAPEFNLQQIAPRWQKQNAFFKRGTIFRRALDVQRARSEPMTVAQITEAVLVAAKITNPTEQEEVDLRAAIRASLEHNAVKTVQRVGDGIPRRWALRHHVAL